jgi:anti-sigma factor RsiW
VSAETEQLSRYLDGDMTPAEVAAVRARLRESPGLRRELAELGAVGAALRQWSRGVEARAGDLLEPTLERARKDAQRRALHARAGYVGAALLLVLLPWARFDSGLLPSGAPLPPAAAAIERVEATDRRAEVFVVGSANTPVLWLADDAPEDGAAAEQDPG